MVKQQSYKVDDSEVIAWKRLHEGGIPTQPAERPADSPIPADGQSDAI